MYAQFNDMLSIEDRPHHIGELATIFDVTLRTIRFYEERGLIRPRRVSARTRVYGRDDVARLGLIVACRRFGLGVDEISDLLAARDRGTPVEFRAELRKALQRRRDVMAAEIAEAETLHAELGSWIVDLSDKH